MMSIIDWKTVSIIEKEKLLQRSAVIDDKCREQVVNIITKVREKGDVAVNYFNKSFDNLEIENFQITPQEIARAFANVGEASITAIKRAILQLEKFHQSQVMQDYAVTVSPGIECTTQFRPIQRVGLYVPAGSAPLISTVLMLAVPAKIANCPQRIICSPAQKSGSIDPHILVAASLCGIETIFKIGGAQAIAAMAYGTKTVPKADKIFGPGNKWVTTAKQLVAEDPQGAALDMPAGPSELLIIADSDASPDFMAADLLSQAEHGNDSQVILVCTDVLLAEAINKEIDRQLNVLPRANIIKQALKKSYAIIASNMDEAIDIANYYAPEHLILNVREAESFASQVYNAGAVFIGEWSSVVIGDYASGANHVLPTHGYAKTYSGLGVKDFMKTITFQKITSNGLKEIAPTVMHLAQLEGLTAHANAIAIRLMGDKS